jgi:hypothetical protein
MLVIVHPPSSRFTRKDGQIKGLLDVTKTVKHENGKRQVSFPCHEIKVNVGQEPREKQA